MKYLVLRQMVIAITMSLLTFSVALAASNADLRLSSAVNIGNKMESDLNKYCSSPQKIDAATCGDLRARLAAYFGAIKNAMRDRVFSKDESVQVSQLAQSLKMDIAESRVEYASTQGVVIQIKAAPAPGIVRSGNPAPKIVGTKNSKAKSAN